MGQSSTQASDCVRNLGVIFDSNMSMIPHVNHMCKKGYHQLTKIRQIKKYIDRKTLETLVHSFVTSNIDYCNSLLYGIPLSKLNKLQKLQNCAARVITGTFRSHHITPVLKELHWLPIAIRVEYKIALLTFKCLHDQAPGYLKDLIKIYRPTRALRSASQNLLQVPRTKTRTLGTRAFTYAAPTVWNSLPQNIRTQHSLDHFKTLLKTYLFNIAY